MIAVESKTTNHFSRNEADLVVEGLKQLTLAIQPAFGMVIYDYCHANNRLVKVASISPIKSGRYVTELERVFPALSTRARRTFEDASRSGRIEVTPVDLAGGETFLIVATPESMVVLGAKTPSVNLSHDLISSMLKIVAHVRDELPSERVVNFRRQREMAM